MRPMLAACLALALLAGPARGGCDGRDLMAALAAEAPAAEAALRARAAATPNGRGILWRVSPGAGERASHLLGTLHSTEAAARGLPAPAAAALSAARVVLLEITPAEQERLARRVAQDPGFLLDPNGPALTERLPARLHAAARAALGRRGIALAAADRLRPWFLLSLLSMPACERAAIAAGAPVLDQAIAAEAAARGIPVAGLETAGQSVAAVSSLSERDMTRLLIDAVAGASQAEDLRRTLETHYAAGEIALAAEVMVHLSEERGAIAGSRETAAALERALMTARNRAWLGRIAAEARRGGAFVAVGALHLPGAEGLVALLRGRGFTVERVPLP